MAKSKAWYEPLMAVLRLPSKVLMALNCGSFTLALPPPVTWRSCSAPTMVVAPKHHSAPETGALAKTASGALERQPYLRVTNLAEAMADLKAMGFTLIGLEGEATVTLAEAVASVGGRPIGLVLGAEGPGLREKTRESCDILARIPYAGGFGSLNVSNAAAVSLYAASRG